jgi:MFS family permease
MLGLRLFRAAELVPSARAARLLAASTLINTLGNGLFLTGGVIFLTRSARLAVNEVGVGLTVAGLVPLLFGVLLGDLADRLGARQVYVATLMLEALATAALVFVHTFAAFLLVATLAAVGSQGSRSSRVALIALIGGTEERVRLRAQLRAITNVGISIGAALAGVALGIDTRAAYVTMILLDAATFLAALALVWPIRSFSATRASLATGERRWIALSDRPYLLVSAVNAVLSLNYAILTVGVPLWVSVRTAAPRAVVAVLLLINTLAIVGFQVRITRSISSPFAAGIALRRAGLAFAAAWTILGLASGVSALAAVMLLTVGVAIHTAGELWQASGSFEISYGLAPTDAMGQYQGVFGLGWGIADAVAPVLAASVCVTLGLGGWVALGGLLASVGAFAPKAVGSAARKRQVPRTPSAPLGPHDSSTPAPATTTEDR